MNEDGYTSSIKDKILSIDVKPGWKEGTRIIFSKEGDQVTYTTPFSCLTLMSCGCFNSPVKDEQGPEAPVKCQ